MIPSLILIRTQTSRRFLITWRRKTIFGLNEHSDIIIHHPIFQEKTSLLGGSEKREQDSGKKKGLLRYFFLIDHLTAKNLSINLFSPGWLSHMILFLCISTLVVSALRSGFGSSVQKQDWSSISLPATGTYGFCRQDRTHPNGIRFDFNAEEAKPHRLVFTPGSSGGGAKLTIAINGEHHFPATPLPPGWGKEISVRLPVNVINVGPNQIEFRTTGLSGDVLHWGIRNVHINFSENSEMDWGNMIGALDSIRTHLRKGEPQNIKELAGYYKLIESIQLNGTEDRFSVDLESVKKTIENQMEERITNTLIQSRAAWIMGNESLSTELLNDARMWIPDNWEKGLEVLNEIDRSH